MKKPLIALLIGALAVAAFYTWKASQKPGQTTGEKPVIVGFENDIVSFDPLRLADVYSNRFAKQIFEGLVTMDAENRIVPALAESWTHSEDLTEWTFRLRAGVKFHPHPALADGDRDLTADDVVYSFTRMLTADAVTAGPMSSVISGAKAYQNKEADGVSGIEIVSPQEVRFKLVRPDNQFPARVSSPPYSIVKRAVVEAAGAEFGQTVGIGTGPFVFSERRGNDLSIRSYVDYWGGNEAPANVVFRTVKEDAVRLAEARAGRIDITYATPPMLTGLAERDGGGLRAVDTAPGALQVRSFPIFDTYFMGFNWPKIDPDLRRAIALAIDRREIVEAVAPLSGTVAPGPIPLSVPGYKTKLDPAPDLEKARAAVMSFRERNPGATPNIRLLAHESAQSIPTSEVIQSQLAKVGIEVEIVQQSFNAVIGQLQKADFDAIVIWFEYTYSGASPQLMLETYFTSSAVPLPNLFQYAKPENDEAIAGLFSISDPGEALSQVAEIERRMVAEDVPGVFLYQTRQAILVSPSIEGLAVNGANHPFLSRVKRK
jgi:peptide/nickel transport system substrate-binding protein